ncbi:MAG: carbohydrate binding domain-containing protein [Candidatus Hydromicrobium sp.]
MILDKDFVYPDSNWIYGPSEGAEAKVEFIKGVAKFNIIKVGSAEWHVQLKTKNYLKIEKDKNYTVKFKAKSDVKRNIQLLIEQNGGSWTKYGEQEITLSKEMKNYSFEFTMENDTDQKAELVFLLGNIGNSNTIGNHTVEISDIYLQ